MKIQLKNEFYNFLTKIQNFDVVKEFFLNEYKLDDKNKIKLIFLYNDLPTE